MKDGVMDRVRADAEAQAAAGAQMLDVNAGIPAVDEPALLVAAIQAVMQVTDVPICIDSSIIEALEAGLSAYEGKALVNSVTAEEERMERILPLRSEERRVGKECRSEWGAGASKHEAR